MPAGFEIRYSGNIWYIIAAVGAAAILMMSFQKKEKIMARLRINYKIRRKVIRGLILFIGMGLMTFSLLRPQGFKGYGETEKTGLDIYVLMDTSKSMLTGDIKPNRISAAKKLAGDLLNSLEGDRIGFIPFASDAYIQMPLTDDYDMARMFLAVMDTDMISGGGSNLSAALKLAVDSFDRSANSDRVILIFSDGEEHDGTIQNTLKDITDSQIKIYSVGIGTEDGGLIPVYSEDGVTVIDYMKDESGNPVVSRLNSQTLRMLANGGNGIYYQGEITPLLSELRNLARDVRRVEATMRFSELYQYFLGAGILLVIIVLIIPEGKVLNW